jgi:tetratricopeptide (TPR) repeat protein
MSTHATTTPVAIEPDLSPLKKALDQILQAPITQQLLEATNAARLDTAYALAWQALAEGRLESATEQFAQLAALAADQFRVQFGFALCLQHQGLIEQAAHHYSTAYVLDPSSASCAFRLGECLNALGYREEAREALVTAVQLCEVPGTDPNIREFATAELDRLS